LSKYLREWGLVILGLTMFVWSLPLYVSWASRPVFARWSYSYFSILVVAVAVWLGFIIFTWRKFNRAAAIQDHVRRPNYKTLLGVSALCWGTAYMLSALHSSADAGRVVDLNIFGSTVPSAALLDWFAIATFALALGLAIGPRLSPRWQGAGLLIATLTFLIVVGEGFARANAILYSETQGFPTYSSVLWERKYVQLNSWGFRDKERKTKAGDGIRRVLMVGDSFTFGTGVRDPKDRFGEQLEERLNNNTAWRWEVINAGRGDTHTLRHIEFLHRMLDFQPELVVLVYVFNDIDYLASVTPRDAVASANTSVGRTLFLNSYLFQELYVRLRKIWLAGANDTRHSLYNDNKLLQTHFNDLRRFVSLANENGAVVRIVPYSFQIERSERALYSRFTKRAADFGLPICGLENAFHGHSAEVLRVNSLDGHPNAYANEIAVQAAFGCLIEGLRPRPQP